MEFWGVEVKPGQTVYCDAHEACVIHISQVALGETEKGSVALVSAKIDDQKVVIGTLSAENHPQIPCDLIFEKQFELSHSSKTASVFVCGYKAHMPIHPSDSSESDSSEDEDEVETVNNQVTNPVVDNVAKPPTPTIKDDKKVADSPDSDEDDSNISSTDSDDYPNDDEYSSLDDDTDSEEDDTSREEMDTSSEEDASEEEDKDSTKPEDGKETVAETALKTSASEDTSNKEDASDEEDKNTPKPEVGKKRAAETALKTPASDKKAKIETPSGQDTDDKKAVHVATPHPAKQAGKPNGKSTKYVGGSHACKSCSRTFGSDSALKSHEKAKHA